MLRQAFLSAGSFITWIPRKLLGNREETVAPYKLEIILLLTIGLSSLFYISLFSFSPLDDSPFSASIPANLDAQNLAGKIGAYSSGFCLFWLGAVAAFLPLPFLELTWKTRISGKRTHLGSRILGWASIFSILLVGGAFVDPYVQKFNFLFSASGALGLSLFQFLTPLLGKVGTIIAALTIGLCGAILITRNPLLQAVSNKLTNCFGKFSRRNTHQGSISAQAEREILASSPSALSSPPPVLFGDLASDQPPEIRQDFEISRLDENDHQLHASSGLERTFGYFRKSPSYQPSGKMFRLAELKPDSKEDDEEQKKIAESLVRTLHDFGIEGKIVGCQKGPVVSVYEFRPDAGVKLAKVLTLIEDIALSLKVESIFIFPVPEKKALGIQVPHEKRASAARRSAGRG